MDTLQRKIVGGRLPIGRPCGSKGVVRGKIAGGQETVYSFSDGTVILSLIPIVKAKILHHLIVALDAIDPFLLEWVLGRWWTFARRFTLGVLKASVSD